MKAKMKRGLVALTALSAAEAWAATEYVRPEIGTEFNGHTTVAAAWPFGLVQAGPDTGHGTWDYCSGYRFADTNIWGFSQTHLSGTGCPDLGDIRLQPGGVDRAYPFDKATEKIAPGRYEVFLKEVGTKVEVTVTPHAAFYRFTYAGAGPAKLLVDTQWMMTNEDNLRTCVLESKTEPDSASKTLLGSRTTKGWVTRKLGFALVTDRAWTLERLPKADPREKGERLVLTFADVKPGDTVLAKIGLSASGDSAKALANLKAEIPAWDFDAKRAAANAEWEKQLSVLSAEGTEDQLVSFYTSLYHLFFQPNNIADVGEKPFYSTFSCWDTFRAAGPLYTVLSPDRAAEFVDSMLAQGKKTGYLPIWTLWGVDNQCMIGTHSVPMIVDWFLKNEKREIGNGTCDKPVSFCWESAYAQIKETLAERHEGRRKENWDLYDRYGYYPFDRIRGESVSRTLECAYDDWCAAQMANKLGKEADYAFFMKRASYWRNVFDPSVGLVRGKDTKGNWREPFDPFALGHGADVANDFTEGNSYQYTWHVMQDPAGLIAASGGKEEFVRRLERLFTLPSKVAGAGFVSDVSGLIGQYAHGNEPSHHVVYFFTLAGRPDLTAKYVRRVFDEFYLPKPDGLCGNDDCGQMSAWYLFSAMGFYPFNPCGDEYVLGAPQVPKAVLKVGGRTPVRFVMTARNLSRENKYVKSVTLNGKPITDWKIRHADIMAGGELVFEMGAEQSSSAR